MLGAILSGTAHGAADQGAGVRRAGGGVGECRTEHVRRTSASSWSSITPRPGHSLTDLETAADAIIERLKREGPTAEEIQKATAGEELSFVRGLESNLGKAFQLANGAGYPRRSRATSGRNIRRRWR